MEIDQIMIGLLGGSAVWFVSQKKPWARWGYVLGLAAQPFWYWAAVRDAQWGIVFVSIIYTYSWAMGVYNAFIHLSEVDKHTIRFNKWYDEIDETDFYMEGGEWNNK